MVNGGAEQGVYTRSKLMLYIHWHGSHLEARRRLGKTSETQCVFGLLVLGLARLNDDGDEDGFSFHSSFSDAKEGGEADHQL